MLTIKHPFNSKIQSVTLVRALGSHFCSPLISNNLLSGCVMVREWGINELFPCLLKFSPKWSVWVCLLGVLSKEKKIGCSSKKCKHISLYIYIYIYYTLYTLFGWLDLMGQSSELEWAHKKSSNNMCPVPLWITMQK